MRCLLPALLLLTGCPSDDESCFLGDPAAAPEIQIVYLGTDGQLHDFSDGGEMPLIRPPQFGKVLYVGARARNLDTCQIQLTSSLRDECTNRIVGLEVRPVTLADDGSGWGMPVHPVDTNVGNLPGCPSSAATRDVEGEPYLLKLRAVDKAGRTAEVTAHVTPVCAEPDLLDECLCECDGVIKMSSGCPPEPDAGGPPGTCLADAGP